jgi:5-(carboxyamino)imidazole ribonucleotide mutase
LQWPIVGQQDATQCVREVSAGGKILTETETTGMSSDTQTQPLVGIIMGSQSDWPTMKHASDFLNQFGVAHERLVVSAHRTPDRMVQYARGAAKRGIRVILAGAGGAAHLPGMVASMTTLPVFGVPVKSRALSGLDSLLSIVQMPGGVPVGTLAIGDSGAKNAALLAIRVLAIRDATLTDKLVAFQQEQAAAAIVDLVDDLVDEQVDEQGLEKE